MRDKVACDKVVFERDGLTCSVDVTKCHACHAKRRSMSPSATPATQSGGGCRQVPATQSAVASRATNGAQARHQSQSQPSATSATHATQNEGGCRQVPHLPRKKKVHVSKSHACHANGTSMSPSATPATQSGAAPRATKTHPSAPPEPAQCHQYHACHAK